MRVHKSAPNWAIKMIDRLMVENCPDGGRKSDCGVCLAVALRTAKQAGEHAINRRIRNRKGK